MDDEPRQMIRSIVEALESAHDALEEAEAEREDADETLQRAKRLAESCANRAAELAENTRYPEKPKRTARVDNPVSFAQSMAREARDVTVENEVMTLADSRLDHLRGLVREAASAYESSLTPTVTTVEIRRVDGCIEVEIGEGGIGEEPGPVGETIDGLGSVREAVRARGGDLTVETSWTEGVSVTFTLGVRPPSDGEVSSADDSGRSSR